MTIAYRLRGAAVVAVSPGLAAVPAIAPAPATAPAVRKLRRDNRDAFLLAVFFEVSVTALSFLAL